MPDFEVFKGKHRLVVECKNVRSGDGHAGDNWATVELQKTRGGLDAQGRKTRGYRVGHFDILGACLFNQTGKWAFRFVQAQDLARRPAIPRYSSSCIGFPTQTSAAGAATSQPSSSRRSPSGRRFRAGVLAVDPFTQAR